MGYNAALFQRHPIQIDAVTVVGRNHFYVRDRKKTLHPCKSYAWPRLSDATYLCVMRFTSGTSDRSNYNVESVRALHPGLAAKLNAELYEQQLLRDSVGATILEDVLHLTAIEWISGDTFEMGELAQTLEAEHSALSAEFTATGTMPPRLPFVATRTLTFNHLLEHYDVYDN